MLITPIAQQQQEQWTSFLVNAVHIADHSVCRTVTARVYFMLSVSQMRTLPKVSFEVSETERLKRIQHQKNVSGPTLFM